MSDLVSDLYEIDGVAWAESQAAALRRRAGHNELDYENLAEEIEDVGRSITRAARSHLEVIIEHLLKLETVRQPENYRGWRASVSHARDSLNDEITPTLEVRLPEELSRRFEKLADYLVDKGVLPESDALSQRREKGYTWAEITSPMWFPEPASHDDGH